MTTGDRCDYLFRSEEMKEAFNKRLVLDFYRAAFTNDPSDFAPAAEEFIIADGYIQHNPNVKDGRAEIISNYNAFMVNVTQSPIEFISHVAADGDLVWIHEKDESPPGSAGSAALVNIFRYVRRLHPI